MLSETPKTSFAENLHTRFRAILNDSPPIEMELIEVVDRRSTPRQEQFSLYFLAPPDTPNQQGTYLVENERLGAGDLFLVPISSDERGVTYQAVFNRLID